MARFDIAALPLAGLALIGRQRVEDRRGSFSRFFCADELAAAGFSKPVAQINHTLTRARGAVRGMHFQHPPHAEDKLVSCLKGEVFDVAVDLRAGSPTFLQWHGEVLSAANMRSLLLPRGFAHGFQTLTDDCELVYLHSHPYAALAEGGLNPRDPTLAIAWPLPPTEMSDRDSGQAFVTAEFNGIRI